MTLISSSKHQTFQEGIPIKKPKIAIIATLSVILLAATITLIAINTRTPANDYVPTQHTPSPTPTPEPTPAPTPPRITRIEGDFHFAAAYGPTGGYTAPFIWDEAHFQNSASYYNAGLATLTLSFAMSSFASPGEDVTGQARNAIDFLSQIEFENIETNHYYITEPHKDSIGVIAAHKYIQANGQSYTLIAVSTRSGGYGLEWASNFTIGAAGYHDGFRLAAQETYGFLADYLSRHAGSFEENVKLWITGYSRGAAVANILAAWLTNNSGIAGLTIPASHIFAYTFATPQAVPTGNLQSPLLHTNIHNIISPADIVTWVAPQAWGFGRYGINHFLPERGQLADPTPFDEMLANLRRIGSAHALNATWYAGGRYAHITETFQYVRFDRVTVFPPGVELSHTNSLIIPFLRDLTTSVAALAIEQDEYSEILEDLVRTLVADVMGDDDFTQRLNTATDIFVGKLSIRNAPEIVVAFVTNGMDGLLELAARYLYESAIEAGIELDGGLSLTQALVNAFWHIGLDGVLTLTHNLEAVIAAHYPEFMLAWLKSQDTNFGGQPQNFIPIYRSVRISGNAHARVYDQGGQLVAWFYYSRPMDIGGHIAASRLAGGDMIVYLPPEMGYTVEITATRRGDIGLTIGEFGLDRADYVFTQSWRGAAVAEDMFVAVIPAVEHWEDVMAERGTGVEYGFRLR